MDILTDHFKHLKIAQQHGKGLSEKQVNSCLLQHIRSPQIKQKIQKLSAPAKTQSGLTFKKFLIFYYLPIMLAACGYLLLMNDPYVIVENVVDYVQKQPCIVESNMFLIEVSRPLFNCDICKDLKDIPIVKDITSEEFAQHYAFTGVPVLVQGATKNWTAPDTFSFHYLKQLYDEEALHNTEKECQFFAYKTGFTTLSEVFQMDDERAALKPGTEPWYIGWSNCDPNVKKTLRLHYTRPYFLPVDSESSSLDWLFMGSTGEGAHIHLDHVSMPSWQAQLKGKKTWYLYPVPECEATCHALQVTLNTGDIFVVDTNQWYHSTFIHPGEMSITIGSEYN